MGQQTSILSGNANLRIKLLLAPNGWRNLMLLCSSISHCMSFYFSGRIVTKYDISPEAYDDADVDSETGIPLDIGIHDIEDHGNAKGNDGFYEKGVLRAFETSHNAGGGQHEIKVIANGHCHSMLILYSAIENAVSNRYKVTENCRRVKGIWQCFGGGG